MGERLPFAGLARAISNLALWSSRNAKLALLVILALTLVLGSGVFKLHTNVDVADVLPRGDFNTTAAKRLSVDFKSAFTQQVTLQFSINQTGDFSKWQADNDRKLPHRVSAANPRNITDEVYVRAIQQFTEYFVERTQFSNVITVSELYSLINWTVAGGQDAPDAAFHLPGTDRQGSIAFATNKQVADAAILDALSALTSPRWTTTAVLIMPDPDVEVDLAELGRDALRVRDQYLADAAAEPDRFYQVFTAGNRPLFTVELPVANAHSSNLVKEDFLRLLPIIGLFILLVLFVAFRNVGSMLIAFTSLSLGVLWTYGVEGHLGIALNSLNLTLMPLIMGVGIDYSIHVVNEFLEHKAEGFSDQRAFQETGRRAGIALFVATGITVLGLMVMVISPSVLIAQFGALAALSITTIFLVALVFIPAALTLWPGTDRMGRSFRPSNLMAGLARGVTKVRWVAIPVVLVAALFGALGAQNLGFESFGDPGRNYLATDPIRQEHEEGLRRFYENPDPAIKANVIVFVGDVTTPHSHAYMRELERSLRNPPSDFEDVIIGDTLRTIPFLMETWLTVKGGGPGAVEVLARQQLEGQGFLEPHSNYPTTRQGIRAEFDALYASPMRELGSIFTNGPAQDYSLGTMTFSARAATYEEAVVVWDAVWTAIEATDGTVGRPADLEVAFVGNTATNYLFVERQIPYLYYMGALSSLALMGVAAAFFRSWRAVATVGLVSFATTAIWMGILPHFGIGLAITLVLPLIFIIALGSDYTVHLLWSFRIVGDRREVFRTVGKAILFSFVTTLGPFLIFTGLQDLAVRKTMVATAIAIIIIFLTTLLVVPSLYKVGPRPVHVVPPAAEIHLEPELAEPLVATRRPKPPSAS